MICNECGAEMKLIEEYIYSQDIHELSESIEGCRTYYCEECLNEIEEEIQIPIDYEGIKKIN